jgi:hypothetical protein
VISIPFVLSSLTVDPISSLIAATLAVRLETLPEAEIRAAEAHHCTTAHHGAHQPHIDPPGLPTFTPPVLLRFGDTSSMLDAANMVIRRAAEAHRRRAVLASLYCTQSPTPLLS